MTSPSSLPAYRGSDPGPEGEPPLDRPYYGAPFGIAVKRFWKKYATFSGRASRSEYWWWTLLASIISVILNIIVIALRGHAGTSGAMTMTAGSVAVTVITWFWSLVTLVPSLALAWRRLHDTNRSGAWYLLLLIPFVGAIILIIWLASKEKLEGQRFDR